MPPRRRHVSGVAAGKAPVVDLSLSGSGIKLAELKKVYPDIGDVSGEVDKFTINLAGTMETLSGVIEFSAPKLGLMGYAVSDSRAQVKLTPTAATVSAKSQFEGAPITAQGLIAEYMTAPKLNLTVNVRSLNLTKMASSFPHLKDLALQGSANADVWVKGTAAAPEVTVKVWSEKISAMKETIESPTVMLALKGEKITISNAAAKWRGAAIAASGSVEGSEKVNITATLENIQPGAVAPFYPDIAKLKIKGAVTAKAVITGKPAAPKIDLTLSSGSLALLDSDSFKNLKVATSLAGDPKALEKAFEIYPDIKAVIVVNLYGTPAKLDEIREICDRHNAIMIEDAAESLGATYKGKPTGSFGAYNAISFHGVKFLTNI